MPEFFNIDFPPHQPSIPPHVTVTSPKQIEEKETPKKSEEIELTSLEKKEKMDIQKKQKEQTQVSFLSHLVEKLLGKSETEPSQQFTSAANKMAQASSDVQNNLNETKETLKNIDNKEKILSQSVNTLQANTVSESQATTKLLRTLSSSSDEAVKQEAKQLQKDENAYTAAIHTADKEILDVKSAISDLNENISHVEGHLPKLASHLQSISKLIESLPTHVKGDVNEKFRQIDQEIDKIKKHLLAAGETTRALFDEVNELARAVKVVQSKLGKAEKEINEAQTAIEKTDVDLHVMKDAIDSNTKLGKEEVQTIDHQFEAKHQEVQKTQGELQKTKELIQDLGTDVKKAKSSAEELQKAANNLAESLENLKVGHQKMIERMEAIEKKMTAGENLETGSYVTDIMSTLSDSGIFKSETGVPMATLFENAAFLLTIPKLGIQAKLYQERKQDIHDLSSQLDDTKSKIAQLNAETQKLDDSTHEATVLKEKIHELENHVHDFEEREKKLIQDQHDLAKEMAGAIVLAGFVGVQGGVELTKAIEVANSITEGTEIVTPIVGGSASVVGGVIGVALSSKEIDDNRTLAKKLTQEYEEVSTLLKKAKEERNELLQAILSMRLENIHQQLIDNAVSTTKNVMNLLASISGTASGAATIGSTVAVGATGGALATVAVGTGIGAAVLVGLGLVIGGGYLVYKKQHAIKHFYNKLSLELEKYTYEHKAADTARKIVAIEAHVKQTRELLDDQSRSQAERKNLSMRVMEMGEEEYKTLKEKFKFEAKIEQLANQMKSLEEQYKIQTDIAALGGQVTAQELKNMKQVIEKASAKECQSLFNLLSTPKNKELVKKDISFLQTPQPDKSKLYDLAMEFIKIPVSE